ncbi:E3 SUMO-protein ligase ZBED1, partial [Frankliniella fusca]
MPWPGFVSNRRSYVWKFFKDADIPSPDVCKCRMCSKAVSCKNGGTTNARQHLRVHHPVQFTEMKKEERQKKLENLGLPPESDDQEQDSDVDGDVSVMSPGSSSTDRPESAASDRSSSTSASLRSPTPDQTPSKSAQRALVQPKLDTYAPLSKKQKEKCDMAVTHYIVSCMRPLNTVDKPGFRLLLRALNPRYEPPSRRTLTAQHLPRLYEETKMTIKALLDAADHRAFTTDAWTSEAHDGYLSLTAHFLDAEWALIDVTLNCRLMTEDHSGEYIGRLLSAMLQEWNIDLSTVSAFTTDNGEDMRIGVEQAGVSRHVRCFAHTVNNGITSFVTNCKVLNRALRKAHELRNWFSSDKVWRHYVEYVKEKYKKTPNRIPSPCKTRWWVDLHIAESVVAQYQWICNFGITYERGKFMTNVPDAELIGVLKAYIKALKPVEKICTVLGGAKYATCSCILPMMYLIDPDSTLYGGDDLLTLGEPNHEEDYDDLPLSDNPEMIPTTIQKSVVKFLKKRFKPDPEDHHRNVDYQSGRACYAVLVRCSFLDPRFKDEILQEDRDEAKKLLLEDIKTMAPPSENLNEESTSGSSSGANAAAVRTLSKIFKKRRLAAVTDDGWDAAAASPPPLETRFLAELDRYGSLPSAETESDPFLWWKAHSASLPILSKLARQFLIITGTSVHSERVFSTGGDVIMDT